VLDEMDLHKREWVAYLNRKEGGCSDRKLGQGCLNFKMKCYIFPAFIQNSHDEVTDVC